MFEFLVRIVLTALGLNDSNQSNYSEDDPPDVRPESPRSVADGIGESNGQGDYRSAENSAEPDDMSGKGVAEGDLVEDAELVDGVDLSWVEANPFFPHEDADEYAAAIARSAVDDGESFDPDLDDAGFVAKVGEDFTDDGTISLGDDGMISVDLPGGFEGGGDGSGDFEGDGGPDSDEGGDGNAGGGGPNL